MLARLYWYMVEFGLIRTSHGLKAYGSGILSSKAETVYSIESPEPKRIAFNLERVMLTNYLIDDFQKTYFVIDSFEQPGPATTRTSDRSIRSTKRCRGLSRGCSW
jgi:phenylalanine-4-hydroxylase